MSPEEKELLEKSVALAQENNKMLRVMKRHMFWSRMMTYLYWALIIGSAVGAYYFLQPYIDDAMDAYQGAKSNIDSVGSFLKNFQN